MKQRERDLKSITDEELTQLIADIDLEQSIRDIEGKRAGANRRREAPAGSIAAISKDALLGLKHAIVTEARKRGVTILPAAPNKQKAFQAVSRAIAQAHRSVALERISAPAGTPKTEEAPAPSVQRPTPPLSRQEIERILGEKGWSCRDWATNAMVDARTVSKYMNGASSYPSTRKKMADALDVPPSSLPKSLAD